MANKTDLKPCPMPGCESTKLRIKDVTTYAQSGKKIYCVICQNGSCGVSGPWLDTPEDAAQSWNEFASIAERARTEQMEADCRAVCSACEEYSVTAPAPTPFPPVYRSDDEEVWWHYGIDEDGDYYQSCRQCDGYHIREAFRAREVEGEA